jgi:TatD DNase family protein
MMLVDTHCHLDYPGLADDLAGVLGRARAAGVVRMVTISTHVRKVGTYRALAEAHEDVVFTVGTHPHYADQEPDITADDLCRLAEHPRCVGIGEAGLDFHYDRAPRDAQRQGLLTHIAAARMSGLPLVIHARAADDAMIRLLSDEMDRGAFPAILHCFSSGPELARTGAALGFFLSMSGILTFRASEELRAIAAAVPRDRLLVETDAPYLAPVPHRGKPNEPAFVSHTARVLADVIGQTPEQTARLTTANAFRAFPKMPRPAAWNAEAAA